MKKLLLYLFLAWHGMCYAQDTTRTPNASVLSVNMWAQFQRSIDSLRDNRNYWYVIAKSLKAENNLLRDTIAQLRNPASEFSKIKGFNTHIFNSAIYSNIDTDIAKIRQAGGNAMRVNINVNADGSSQNEAKLQELITKCKAANILIMPMVNIDQGDLNVGYTAGFAMGKGFTKYGFKYTEAGNELSIKNWDGKGRVALKSGDGDTADDYDLTLLAQIAQTVKGFCDGVRAGDPGSKIIIDSEWLHTYYMEYLINTVKCPIDILAWHWYSGQAIARTGKESIRSILKRKFPNLPIIWNEVGVDTDNTTGTIPPGHYTAFSSMVSDMSPDPIVYYELFDEAVRLPSKKEAGYGFFDVNLNPKPVVNLIK